LSASLYQIDGVGGVRAVGRSVTVVVESVAELGGVGVDVIVAVVAVVIVGDGALRGVAGASGIFLGSPKAVCVGVGVPDLDVRGVRAVDGSITVVVEAITDLVCVRVHAEVTIVTVRRRPSTAPLGWAQAKVVTAASPKPSRSASVYQTAASAASSSLT
jgi:hypothetical protein